MKKIIVLIFMGLIATNAMAFDTNSWYVEPSLGLVVGDYELDYKAVGTHTPTGFVFNDDETDFGNVAGLALGANLGYHWDNFFLAGQLRYNFLTYQYFTVAGSEEYSAVAASFGGVFGYRFDFGLGFWLGLTGEAVQIGDDGKTEMYTGSGVTYGIGYKWTNWALNFEYSQRTYNTYEGDEMPVTENVDGVDITLDEMRTNVLQITLSRYISF